MGSFSTETRSRVGGRLCEESTHRELEIIENAEETMKNENNYSPTWLEKKTTTMTKKKKKNEQVVFLEGYVEAGDEDELARTKSLTEEDLEELRGCLDLGFGFSYEEIPELCNTLPALELCYSMTQRFLDEHHHHKTPEPTSAEVEMCSSSPPPGPIANWKIFSPGDHPEDVKARLKYWAQAVACTVRLCS
ncbi:hypothetical protein U1Q18_025043 [Sarracenia purpurea var. burkii]